MALNSLAVEQKKPTIHTAIQITKFLNYSATHSDAVIEYRRSGMILHVYSDASYLSEPEAQSRSGENSFLGPTFNTPIHAMPPENIPVYLKCSIMKNIMVSATDAYLGKLCETFQKATSVRT